MIFVIPGSITIEMAKFVVYDTTDTNRKDTKLAANAEVTLQQIQPEYAENITGTVFADKAGTLFIEQSLNGGANWDVSASYTIKAGEGAGFNEKVVGPLARLRYKNGAEEQGTFRLFGRAVVQGR